MSQKVDAVRTTIKLSSPVQLPDGTTLEELKAVSYTHLTLPTN